MDGLEAHLGIADTSFITVIRHPKVVKGPVVVSEPQTLPLDGVEAELGIDARELDEEDNDDDDFEDYAGAQADNSDLSRC